jgi:hypothetical protein
MITPKSTKNTRRASSETVYKSGWFARLSLRLWRSQPSIDRRSALSNLDWVIEMLHSVRENKPADLERWWNNLKDDILGGSPPMIRSTAQTKARESTKH